ncbi:MAG: PKD domain-containing protein [Pseudomonadales bacterium]
MIARAHQPVARRQGVGRVALVLLLLTAGCDDAHVVACIGDQEFCERVITANVPPEADAGADQQVAAGDSVSLDGTDSNDPDGQISSYSWTQLTGTAVTLLDADQATARFDAPEVDAAETLTFRLTVVDAERAAAADDVSVEVLPVVALAARAGLALLSRAAAPAPLLTPETCAATPPLDGEAWFAQAGLWLAAHASGLEREADPNDVTTFLDAARLLLAHSEQRRAPPGVASSLWFLGLEALERHAHTQDPAVAEWAARILSPAARTLPAQAETTLTDRLLRGEVTIVLTGADVAVVEVDPALSVRRSSAFLREAGCHRRIDPIRLAADTVFLLAQQRDVR